MEEKNYTVEEVINNLVEEHNKLLTSVSREFIHLHNKLVDLQSRLEKIEKAGERRIIL